MSGIEMYYTYFAVGRYLDIFVYLFVGGHDVVVADIGIHSVGTLVMDIIDCVEESVYGIICLDSICIYTENFRQYKGT